MISRNSYTQKNCRRVNGSGCRVELVPPHWHISPLVTDNFSNVVVATKEANFHPHIRCFVHSINLATQYALQVNSKALLLGRIRRIMAFFHQSMTATSLFRGKQKLLQLPHHKLVIPVATCWDSAYDMIERFLEQQQAVTTVLMSCEMRQKEKDINTLSESDISIAEGLHNIQHSHWSMTLQTGEFLVYVVHQKYSRMLYGKPWIDSRHHEC